MTTDPVFLVCDIVATFTGIPADRVVIYDQSYEAPKDDLPYVIVMIGNSRTISKSRGFDPETDEQVLNLVKSQDYDIRAAQFTKNVEDVQDLIDQIELAFISQYALEVAELNELSFYRATETLDLPVIEGPRPITRKQWTVNVQYKKTKKSAAPIFDKFTNQEVKIES